MPGIYGEYNRPTVTSSGCSYATLDSYNQNYFGRGAVGAPTLAQTRSAEVIVIPSYGSIGYNVLQPSNQQPSCSGYNSMMSAYPNFPDTCGQFSSQLC